MELKVTKEEMIEGEIEDMAFIRDKLDKLGVQVDYTYREWNQLEEIRDRIDLLGDSLRKRMADESKAD